MGLSDDAPDHVSMEGLVLHSVEGRCLSFGMLGRAYRMAVEHSCCKMASLRHDDDHSARTLPHGKQVGSQLCCSQLSPLPRLLNQAAKDRDDALICMEHR